MSGLPKAGARIGAEVFVDGKRKSAPLLVVVVEENGVIATAPNGHEYYVSASDIRNAPRADEDTWTAITGAALEAAARRERERFARAVEEMVRDLRGGGR